MIVIKDEENNNAIHLTEEEYEIVAQYVRNQDRIDYATNVLSNNLSCDDSGKSNIEEFIINNLVLLEKYSYELNSAINDNTGEQEYYSVENFVRKELEAGYYKILICTGAESEREETVILPKELASVIQKNIDTCVFSNGSIYSESGEEIETCLINKISYVSSFEI